MPIIEGVIATTHKSRKYEGERLTVEDLEVFARSLRNQHVQMHLDHDLTERLSLTVLDASVQPRDADGAHELRVKLLVDDDTLGRIGERTGFSVSYFRDRRIYGWRPGLPRLFLAADATRFSADLIDEVAFGLRDRYNVEASRLYQLSFDPVEVAKVVVAIGGSLLLGVQSAWMYDRLKKFLPQSSVEEDDPRPAWEVEYVLTQRVESGDGVTVIESKAIVRTNSEEVLKRALDALASQALSHDGVCVYEPDSGRWTGIT